jgi:nicotinamidase/pyrazinamidase
MNLEDSSRMHTLLIDIQNDFCPGGALAVPEGNRIVPVANRLIAESSLVVATQDWHPAEHGSFAANHPDKEPGDMVKLGGTDQILWPTHCVQGTAGAAFHPDLDASRIDQVFQKGTDPKIDSYSGFFDNDHRTATGLGEFLKARGVRDLSICGLATDYCVKFTVMDALALGFKVTVVTDACRGVNLQPGDSTQAWVEMRQAGAHLLTSKELIG